MTNPMCHAAYEACAKAGALATGDDAMPGIHGYRNKFAADNLKMSGHVLARVMHALA